MTDGATKSAIRINIPAREEADGVFDVVRTHTAEVMPQEASR